MSSITNTDKSSCQTGVASPQPLSPKRFAEIRNALTAMTAASERATPTATWSAVASRPPSPKKAPSSPKPRKVLQAPPGFVLIEREKVYTGLSWPQKVPQPLSYELDYEYMAAGDATYAKELGILRQLHMSPNTGNGLIAALKKRTAEVEIENAKRRKIEEPVSGLRAAIKAAAIAGAARTGSDRDKARTARLAAFNAGQLIDSNLGGGWYKQDMPRAIIPFKHDHSRCPNWLTCCDEKDEEEDRLRHIKESYGVSEPSSGEDLESCMESDPESDDSVTSVILGYGSSNDGKEMCYEQGDPMMAAWPSLMPHHHANTTWNIAIQPQTIPQIPIMAQHRDHPTYPFPPQMAPMYQLPSEAEQALSQLPTYAHLDPSNGEIQIQEANATATEPEPVFVYDPAVGDYVETEESMQYRQQHATTVRGHVGAGQHSDQLDGDIAQEQHQSYVLSSPSIWTDSGSYYGLDWPSTGDMKREAEKRIKFGQDPILPVPRSQRHTMQAEVEEAAREAARLLQAAIATEDQ
ncbi:hypothetical protein F5Y18DRAFT_103916 [Xylariaceae sp. FL1019]|nr:hypothetical protein F5Y18DRAFT_103916 [Xylariaceae sp. FL1019]